MYEEKLWKEKEKARKSYWKGEFEEWKKSEYLNKKNEKKEKDVGNDNYDCN